MNPHPYAPNFNQLRPDQYSSPDRANFRGRNSPNTSTAWRSPAWTPRAHLPASDYNRPNSMMKSNFMAPRCHFSSPSNNSYSYQKQSSSYISTPRSSGNSSFSSDSSGFIPLPYSPSEERWKPETYGRRGENRSRGRRSYDRRSFHEKTNNSIEMYFKPSMLLNPWKKLEKSNSSCITTKEINDIST